MIKQMRSPNEVGSLWPLCKNCRHIAQGHPEKKGESKCSEPKMQQCPTCKTHVKMPCQCDEYIGPNRVEFAKLINATDEEIEYYRLY